MQGIEKEFNQLATRTSQNDKVTQQEKKLLKTLKQRYQAILPAIEVTLIECYIIFYDIM